VLIKFCDKEEQNIALYSYSFDSGMYNHCLYIDKNITKYRGRFHCKGLATSSAGAR